MLPTGVSYLWFFSILSQVSSLSFDDWHCGTGVDSRNISFNTIMDDCPDFAVGLNHCCVIHDDCYVKQLGQGKCDDDFCKCNENVLKHPGGSQCQGHANMVCILMPFFGMAAYEASANYTEPDDIPKYSPEWIAIQDEYPSLYQACPEVNTTISSCALQLNECVLDFVECAEQLCDCLNNAYIVTNSSSCLTSTNNLCSLALQESQSAVIAQTFAKRVIFSVFAIVIFLFFVLLSLHATVNRLKRKRLDRKIKYTMVA